MHTDARHLAAPATVVLPDLSDLGRVAVGESGRTSTAHVDTEDLALLRWGVRLRHDGQQWRLDLPAVATIPDTPLVHTWTGGAASPPADALALLPAFLRGRRVVRVARVARVATRRVTRTLHDSEGEPVVDVHDDEVSVFHGRRLAERFRELVVVPTAEAGPVPDVLEEVVGRMLAAGARAADPDQRRLRIFGPRLLDGPDLPEPELGGEPTATEVVRAAVVEGTRRLVLADPHARLGIDEEGVHQARVATRRLRSDLRTFRPLLDGAWTQQLRDELKWTADVLGRVRDADVLTGRLAAAIAQLAPQDQRHAGVLRDRIAAQRAAARQSMRQALSGDRYLALLDRLVAAAHDLTLVDGVDGPADRVLPGVVQHPWKRLKADVADLGDDPADELLHAVRLRAKRARYAAEAVQDTVGKPARRFATAAARVQGVLGDHQDACVAADWLRAAAEDATDRHEAFVAGVLAGREQAAAARLRDEWEDAWSRLDRRKVTGWL